MMRWWLTIPLRTSCRHRVLARRSEPRSRSSTSRRTFGRSWSRTASRVMAPKKQNAGLRLDTAAGLKAGADGTAVVVAGRTGEEQAHQGREPGGRIPDAAGAKPPLPPKRLQSSPNGSRPARRIPGDLAVKPNTDSRKHWAFQPVKAPRVPTIREAAIPDRKRIDAFVLAKLARRRGCHSRRARTERTLIRRAYFDLDRPPADRGGGRGVREGHRPEGVGEGDRPAARDRRSTANAGVATGSTSPATPTRRATSSTRTAIFRSRTPIATTSSARSTKTSRTTGSSSSNSPPTSSTLGDDKRPLAALGFLTLGRRFLNNPARHHRRPHRRGDAGD